MDMCIDEYRELGVTKINNIFSDEDLSQISVEIDRLKELAVGMPSGSYVNFADKEKGIINSIHRLEEFDTSLRNFAESDKVKGVAEACVGKDPILFSIQLFLKPAGKGLATPAHQDNAFWHLSEPGGITIWIALDDVNLENGAVQFVPRSHMFGLVPHVKSHNTPGSSRVISAEDLTDKNWVNFNLRPGDCTVHCGLSIHRSAPNVSGKPRRALLFNFKAKGAVRDEAEFARYNADLENINGRLN